MQERINKMNQEDALEDAIDEPCIYDEFGISKIEDDSDLDSLFKEHLENVDKAVDEFYQEMMDLDAIRKGEARA